MKTPEAWKGNAESVSRILETEGLDGFHRIVENGIGLGRLLILGRFVIHGPRAVFLIRNNPPKMSYPLIPVVVSGLDPRPYVNSLPSGEYAWPSIPHSTLRCPHCQLGWTLASCHDFKCIREPFQLEKSQCNATTLGEMHELYLKPRHDAIYTIESKHPVFNKNWIKPGNTVIPDPKTLPPSFVIREGDVLYFKKHIFFHEACYREHFVRERSIKLETILKEAGFQMTILQFTRKNDRNGQVEIHWYAHTEIGTLQISESNEFYSVDTEHCGLRKCNFSPPVFHEYDDGFWESNVEAEFVTLLSNIRTVGMKKE